MNDQDKARKRNDIARFFRQSSKIHRNCIRLNPANTLAHEMKKVELCWEFLKDGKEFVTEAEFESPFKKRADIVCLDDGVVIEIVHSESQESIDEKKKGYPLPIVVIKA